MQKPIWSGIKILVLGYGNIGRRDDGLGIAFAERVRDRCPGIAAQLTPQLKVEDSLSIVDAEVVVFADASRGIVEPFRFQLLQPAGEFSCITHALSPAAVLALGLKLYGARPEAYLMEIGGADWELGEGLSAQGQTNLGSAIDFFCQIVKQGDCQAFRRAAGRQASQAY